MSMEMALIFHYDENNMRQENQHEEAENTERLCESSKALVVYRSE